jgi:hypothetical protein
MDTANTDADNPRPAPARVGLILVAEASFFLIAAILSAAFAPGTALFDSNLSEFGALQSTAASFNVLLIGVGLLNFLAAHFWRRDYSGRLASFIFLLAGIGAVGAGVVNVGIERDVHGAFATVGFFGQLAIPFVLARSASGGVRLITYLSGLWSVAFSLLWVVGMLGFEAAFGTIGKGGTQLLILCPYALWMMDFGIYLLASRKRPYA